jgi:hypothetical protein
MTKEEKIDQTIYDKSILCGEIYLGEKVRGKYSKSNNGKIICINTILSDRQRYETKVHEVIHDEYTMVDLVSAPTEVTRIEEARVRRWEIEYLMPMNSLIEAFFKGYTTPLDLADFLEITPEKLDEGINLYIGIHGYESIHGQYRVQWQPFEVKKDRRLKP